MEIIDGVAVIQLSGKLDSNTAPMLEEKALPLAQRDTPILLDMSGISYMSSAGLRVLLLLYRSITQHTGRVVLAGLNEEVRDTMAITGFLEFFTVCHDRSEGLAALTDRLS